MVFTSAVLIVYYTIFSRRNTADVAQDKGELYQMLHS